VYVGFLHPVLWASMGCILSPLCLPLFWTSQFFITSTTKSSFKRHSMMQQQPHYILQHTPQYSTIKYSPHSPLCGSLIRIIFWSQYTSKAAATHRPTHQLHIIGLIKKTSSSLLRSPPVNNNYDFPSWYH